MGCLLWINSIVFLEDIQPVDGFLMMKYQTDRCNNVVLFCHVNAEINIIISSRVFNFKLNFVFNTITCIFQCELPYKKKQK